MREEMAATAEKRGRNKEIARGMVDEELNFTHLVVNGDSVLVDDIEGMTSISRRSNDRPDNMNIMSDIVASCAI